MNRTAHIVFTALFALSIGGAASAESPAYTGSVSAINFEANMHDRLDAAFENFTSQGAVDLSGLAGPTSMNCVGSGQDNLETCVVRLVGNPPPPSLAQN